MKIIVVQLRSKMNVSLLSFNTIFSNVFQAQGEALKAARQFQTANGVYKAAKETVALAESRLTEDVNTAAAQLTSAWQEMLNHAITKVMPYYKKDIFKIKNVSLSKQSVLYSLV